MRYKLNIELANSVNFIDFIMFDSLLLNFYIRDKFGSIPTKLHISENELIELPEGMLAEHPDGYYLSSFMLFDSQQDLQFTSYFTKHFDVRHSHYAKFKGKRKILTNKGDYKSYQLPQLLHSINHVWFVFESNDIETVRYLLNKHLFALGKKRNRGWGLVKSWNIEESNDKIKRFIPVKDAMSFLQDNPEKPIIYIRIKPPYWEMEGSIPCIETEI